MENKTKRKGNKIVLKVKYAGPTNTLGSRIIITQSNTVKKVTINFDYNYSVTEKIEKLLNQIGSVLHYNQIVDNTNTNYYLYVINSRCNHVLSFPDIIAEIKKLEV